MDIKQTASDLIDQGKAALDLNGDGKVEAKEVADALAQRAGETVDAVVEAADHVKEGFDANKDGKVSFEEVRDVAEAAAEKAKDAVEDFVDKLGKK